METKTPDPSSNWDGNTGWIDHVVMLENEEKVLVVMPSKSAQKM